MAVDENGGVPSEAESFHHLGKPPGWPSTSIRSPGELTTFGGSRPTRSRPTSLQVPPAPADRRSSTQSRVVVPPSVEIGNAAKTSSVEVRVTRNFCPPQPLPPS